MDDFVLVSGIQVEFDYKNASGEVLRRTVDIEQIDIDEHYDNQGNEVHGLAGGITGFCHVRSEERSFSLDSIRSDILVLHSGNSIPLALLTSGKLKAVDLLDLLKHPSDRKNKIKAKPLSAQKYQHVEPNSSVTNSDNKGKLGCLILILLCIAVGYLMTPDRIETTTDSIQTIPVENTEVNSVSAPTVDDIWAEFKKLQRRGTGHTINNLAATTLYFGSDSRFLEFTFATEKQPEPFEVYLANDRRDPNFNVSLNWDGETYVLSSKHETHFMFTLDENGANMAGKLVTIGADGRPVFVEF
ncbi:hypothetical protein [Bowmanella denitrificans]|uniref:hypothetical protein n=1 Tax=Bowmanella denitrificans TaxID=366582 RepID=UPI000C9D2134|nr:hypothetical protein [Bowmanella denitrificans]